METTIAANTIGNEKKLFIDEIITQLNGVNITIYNLDLRALAKTIGGVDKLLAPVQKIIDADSFCCGSQVNGNLRLMPFTDAYPALANESKFFPEQFAVGNTADNGPRVAVAMITGINWLPVPEKLSGTGATLLFPTNPILIQGRGMQGGYGILLHLRHGQSLPRLVAITEAGITFQPDIVVTFEATKPKSHT